MRRPFYADWQSFSRRCLAAVAVVGVWAGGLVALPVLASAQTPTRVPMGQAIPFQVITEGKDDKTAKDAGQVAKPTPPTVAGTQPTPQKKPEIVVKDFAAFVRLAGFSNLLEIRQSGQKRRIEIATDALVQTFVEDRENGALMVLMGSFGRRLAYVFPMPTAQGVVPLPLDHHQLMAAERLRRLGADNVAGVPCDLYRYQNYQGTSGEACVAKEGVVLRLRPDGRKDPVMQIERIVFMPQEDSYFQLPPTYSRVALPGIGGEGFQDATPDPGTLRPFVMQPGGQPPPRATITILDGSGNSSTTVPPPSLPGPDTPRGPRAPVVRPVPGGN